MKSLKVAVIGAGHLGRIHARLLAGLEGFTLVGVADPVEASRRAVAATHAIQDWPDHRHLAGQVDAAVVAAPTRFHRQIALDLMSQGIHLLVEKPLAYTLAEADELVEAARRRSLVLQVGHVERFNPAFTAALPHLREPKYIEAVRRGGYSFRSTDIGVVMDLMIHDIDLVLALTRSPLKRAEALGVALFGQREDVANARLTFENGCVATLSASRASHTAARSMHVWSARGFAGLDFATRTANVVHLSPALARREVDVDGMTPEALTELKESLMRDHLPVEALVCAPCDAITAELQDFGDSIRDGRMPRVSGEQGRDAIAVAEQVLSSIATHAWDGDPAGLVGPLAQVAGQPLRGPHWSIKTATPPLEHREAG